MKGCTFCKYTSAAPKKELKNQDFLDSTDGQDVGSFIGRVLPPSIAQPFL
jgi:hypothetical protein